MACSNPRVVCQTRNLCNRGCSFGAYFSSLSASLPAAERTGNLTIINDRIVAEAPFSCAPLPLAAFRSCSNHNQRRCPMG